MDGNYLALFEKIGHQANDVYFVFDIEQKAFTYLSPAFEAIWSVPATTIFKSATALIDTIHPEDRAHAQTRFLDSLKEGRSEEFEFRIISPDAQEKYIQVCAYFINKDSVLNVIAGIAKDITVLKSNILFSEKINARKNTILDILGHDLKGPIGVINMLASGIQRDMQAEQNERVLNTVGYIQELCRRNIALIRDLMNQEFLESTEVDLRKERADLVWEINDIIKFYQGSADVLTKTFVLNSSHDRLWIQIDSLKLMQAINNLISNAIKFTAEHGVIEVVIQDQEQTVKITVRDNGIGIPEEMHPYLFDRFTRARRKGLNGEDPIGLGMSIVKTIVELHGGTVNFTSQENQGTAFYIIIPK